MKFPWIELFVVPLSRIRMPFVPLPEMTFWAVESVPPMVLADAPYTALAMVLDVDRMPLDAFPRVAAYLERLRARPSYRSISPQTSLADSAGREE